MKRIIVWIIGAAIFAVPCAYDISSNEPSPLAGLVALSACFTNC